MCTDATLRGKVPDARVSVWTVIDDVVGRSTKRGIFVVRPQHTSGTLEPRRDFVRSNEVPAKDDRCDRNAGESSADGIGRRAYVGRCHGEKQTNG